MKIYTKTGDSGETDLYDEVMWSVVCVKVGLI